MALGTEDGAAAGAGVGFEPKAGADLTGVSPRKSAKADVNGVKSGDSLTSDSDSDDSLTSDLDSVDS